MNNILKFFLTASLPIALSASCSKMEEVSVPNDTHVFPMTFHGGVSGYESTILKSCTTTKAESSWTDGEKVYITFYNGGTKVPGEAVYSSVDGWKVTFDGDLDPGVDLKCEVRYFVNPSYANQYLVNFDHTAEVYEALNGRYTLDGDSLSVSATLSPKVGRMRFLGDEGDVIFVAGFSEYTSFSPANGLFSSQSTLLKLTVGEDGSTPYFYGFFTNDDRLVYLVGPSYAYTRTFPSDILKAGDSGYVNIPTASSHYNWKIGVHVPVNGVTFKMMPVVGYRSGLYLMAETETTEAQYAAVVDGYTPAIPETLPVVNVTYGDIRSFINKLRQVTGLSFDLPDGSEWTYAARGADQSQSYRYAGSNDPNAVAWYIENSGGVRHEVKTKSPNEIGLYDMSGNVSEYVIPITYYSSYDYCRYGGDYQCGESSITTTSYGYTSSPSAANYYGFRLKLTINDK